MTAAYAFSDMLVLAKRSLLRVRRQPDLLVGYTVQPIMFVLLFLYVFGGAIQVPGLDYVDFLIPGIIVQSMIFGGFVTALGLSDDLKKGLIDRFRSLPMWSPAVVAGRILGDVGLNILQLVIMLGVGILAGQIGEEHRTPPDQRAALWAEQEKRSAVVYFVNTIGIALVALGFALFVVHQL